MSGLGDGTEAEDAFEDDLAHMFDGGLVLIMRDPSGGLIDRTELLDPDAMMRWLEQWGAIVAEPGVVVELTLTDGTLLGRLTDEGFGLTAVGRIPIEFGLFGLVG